MPYYTIREYTLVTGWTHDERPSGRVEFEGHIDLQEAIKMSADQIRVGDGAYVSAKHVVEAQGLQSWSGNT